MATTLADLTLAAQQYSDNVGSNFVATTGTAPVEWTRYVNVSLQDVYGLTAQVYGADYYMQSPATGYTFTTTGLTQFYALPTDFFKLLGLDVLYGAQNQWIGLKPFPITEHNRYNWTNTPAPAAGLQFRMFYIPRVTLLVNPGDTIPDALDINGWGDLIAVNAAIMALTKEESDTSALMARKQEFVARINAEAENRDAASADKIVDVRGRMGPGLQYHIAGSNLWLIGFQIGFPFFGMEWDAGNGYGGSGGVW